MLRDITLGQYYPVDSLLHRLDPRTKLFILCNPQNPTGHVFTKEELTKLGNICMKYHVIVLADEIHQDLVSSGHKHIPFASICEEFEQNSVSFMNPSMFRDSVPRPSSLQTRYSRMQFMIS